MESICHLAQVLIASVTATFVCHIFLGEDPAFVIPSIGHLSGILYVLVIPTAGLAALAGAAFQKGTLILRDRIKRIKRIPVFLKPAVGAAMNWLIGISVFFANWQNRRVRPRLRRSGKDVLRQHYWPTSDSPGDCEVQLRRLPSMLGAVLAGSFRLPSSLALQSVSPSLTRLRTRAAPAGERSDSADGGWDECLFRSGRASADYFDSYCVRRLVGLIDRSEILTNQLPKVAVVPAQAMPAHSTIREAVAKMVENSLRLRVVVSTTENTPIGIVTLHDVLRLQNQLSDDALD